MRKLVVIAAVWLSGCASPMAWQEVLVPDPFWMTCLGDVCVQDKKIERTLGEVRERKITYPICRDGNDVRDVNINDQARP